MKTHLLNDNLTDALIVNLDRAITETRDRLKRLEQARRELVPTSNGNGKHDSTPPPSLSSPFGIAYYANIPSLITAVMRDHGKPMTAGDVVARVRHLRPEAAPTSVYPAVYRMAHNGRLLEDKTAGPRLYTLAASP
jgi:hypothetical protein